MKILIVTDPQRRDFYNYLIEQNTVDEFYILWYYSSADQEGKQVNDSNIKGNYYWENYLTPFQLINKIQPDKIVFLEIIDLWQIPLIVACKKKNIRTIFLEHGVGNNVEFVIGRFKENLPLSKKGPIFYNKLKNTFGRAFRNRIFFFSALGALNSIKSGVEYCLLLIYIKLYTPIQALSKLRFAERTPDFAILFNENNVAPFQLYNSIDDSNIITNGVPFFDKFYRGIPIDKDYFVFVEHPYLEEGILGWDDGFHEKIARQIEKVAVERRKKIYVKLHPRSNIQNWKRYNLNQDFIEILQFEDVTSLLLEAQMILGFSSTLLSVMISCKKNVVLLGWHPEPKIFGMDYSKTGLSHVSFHMGDLNDKLDFWMNTNLSINNPVQYSVFQKEFNNPFDGKATERIIHAINNL